MLDVRQTDAVGNWGLCKAFLDDLGIVFYVELFVIHYILVCNGRSGTPVPTVHNLVCGLFNWIA